MPEVTLFGHVCSMTCGDPKGGWGQGAPTRRTEPRPSVPFRASSRGVGPLKSGFTETGEDSSVETGFCSDEAEFFGFEGGLCPIAHTQFAEDIGDVILGRALGDDERGGDLFVARAGRDEAQDF